MTEYTSDIKTIPYTDADIYKVLSDLSKLEQLKDKVPADKWEKVKDFSCDKDSVTITVDPVGKVRFLIVDRTSNNTIKFEAEQLPFAFNLWIQLKQVEEQDTKMKLTVKADLNMFLKPMVSKPLQEGLNKMAEMLSALPYDKL
ncbi:SRPBCC family protein [Dysgonomonas sp. 520]|uniref:SRPBCC family protein n=1 Tax=Dysgonomonas sp. 520 TaxID=2302931 RepID=UPI0013D6232E|nr:SRPBCC family protein [Dysgonomonas sp. 520]NDW09891.1 SRPBCC family protein [Dysgonomonas sp. 520]